MHPTTLCLDEAFILLALEEQAFAEEEDDVMRFFGEIRYAVLDEAWGQREGCDQSIYRARLRVILERHEALQKKMQETCDDLRKRLVGNKKHDRLVANSAYRVARDNKAMSFVQRT